MPGGFDLLHMFIIEGLHQLICDWIEFLGFFLGGSRVCVVFFPQKTSSLNQREFRVKFMNNQLIMGWTGPEQAGVAMDPTPNVRSLCTSLWGMNTHNHALKRPSHHHPHSCLSPIPHPL